MKTVTFISHYFCKEIKLRLTNDKYDKLMHNPYLNPIPVYFLDVDRVSNGISPVIFSSYQIKRLHRALLGIDYWDKVI